MRHQAQSWNSGTNTWNTTTQTLYVYDAHGQLAAEYYSAPQPGPACGLNGTAGTCYLTADTLGSTRLMTSQDASPTASNPVARYDYLPFGEEKMGTA